MESAAIGANKVLCLFYTVIGVTHGKPTTTTTRCQRHHLEPKRLRSVINATIHMYLVYTVHQIFSQGVVFMVKLDTT